MPKINVYVNEEDYAFLMENNLSQTAEFRARLDQLRSGEVEAVDGETRMVTEPGRIAYVRVTDGKFELKPNQTIIGHHIKNEHVTRLIVIE